MMAKRMSMQVAVPSAMFDGEVGETRDERRGWKMVGRKIKVGNEGRRGTKLERARGHRLMPVPRLPAASQPSLSFVSCELKRATTGLASATLFLFSSFTISIAISLSSLMLFDFNRRLF